jgi:hypothetical protein
MSSKMIFNVYNGYTPLLKRTFLLLGSFFIMIDYSVRYFPDVIDTPVIGPFFKVRIFLYLVSSDIFGSEASHKYLHQYQNLKYYFS